MKFSPAWPWILSCLFLYSCFRTREVEAPVSNASSGWVSPTEYQTLISNFRNAVDSREVQNYLRCFSQDSFRFIPATEVYTGNQLIWDSWSRSDEQEYFNNMVADLAVLSGNGLVLNQKNIQFFGTDSILFTGSYDLTWQHADTVLTKRFTGQLDFTLVQNSFNEWEIRQWKDYETATDSCWSRLKIKYVQ